MLRRFRGALILGGLWASAWLPVGCLLALGMRWIKWPLRQEDVMSLAVWTGLGLVSGCVFAALLAVRERDETLDSLSKRRLALWGILAGFGVPTTLSALLLLVFPYLHLAWSAYPTFALLGCMGGASALGTIELARRAPARAESLAPPT